MNQFLTPIPLSDLTDDQIRAADLIHVTDPADLGFQAWVPVRPSAVWAGSGGVGPVVLRVAAGRTAAGELLADLRSRIWRITNPPVAVAGRPPEAFV